MRVGDLRDEDYLDRMLNGIDIICHAAGWPSFQNNRELARKHYLEPSIDLINRALEWRVKRFVNLSNIAVASLTHRNDPSLEGKPRRHAAMLNCMIGVENYLKSRAGENFSVVNLRCGIYSGKRLNMGVLPALLDRTGVKGLPEVTGRYGYFPLVDGRDIGQAFARAALAPSLAFYKSMNIVGPEVPRQKEIYQFLNREFKLSRPFIRLPALLFHCYRLFAGLVPYRQQTLLPRGLSDFMTNPLIDNKKSSELIGYNPEIHWTASLQDSWLARQGNSQPSPLSRPVNSSDIQ